MLARSSISVGMCTHAGMFTGICGCIYVSMNIGPQACSCLHPSVLISIYMHALHTPVYLGVQVYEALCMCIHV